MTIKTPRPRRALRTVFLGDLRYPSVYRAGIAQAVGQRGGLHRDVSIRDEPETIDRQVREMGPDVIFTHMLLWPPAGAPLAHELVAMCELWRRAGARVVIHDGDPRSATRFPHDVSGGVDLALCNHKLDRSAWKVPVLHWPYAAFAQEDIAPPLPGWRADLVFAGILREADDDTLYGERTACVRALQKRLGMRLYPEDVGFNNRLQVADVAPSCIAAVGFGRPGVSGWVDTRVYTWPGAGGVLIHDDAHSVLEPMQHYVPCERYDVDSILRAFEVAKRRSDAIRIEAFKFVQSHHTWQHRLQAVLEALFE